MVLEQASTIHGAFQSLEMLLTHALTGRLEAGGGGRGDKRAVQKLKGIGLEILLFPNQDTSETWLFLEILLQFTDGANCTLLCVREGTTGRGSSTNRVRSSLTGPGWHVGSFTVFSERVRGTFE